MGKTARARKTLIRPVNDRVFVSRDELEELSPGGIVLPEQHRDKEKKITGKVVAVGPGRLLPDGTRSKLQVEVGDIVAFGSFAETITIEDVSYVLLHEDDIYAVLETK